MSKMMNGPFSRQTVDPCYLKHFGFPTEAALLGYRESFWTSHGCPVEKLPAYRQCTRCRLWRFNTDVKSWEGRPRPVVPLTPDQKRRARAAKNGDRKYQA